MMCLYNGKGRELQCGVIHLWLMYIVYMCACYTLYIVNCCTQLVGPLEEGESFSEQDYAMLAQMENSSHAHAVAEAVGGVAVGGVSPDEDTSAFRSRLALKVSSLLRSQPYQRRIETPKLKDKHR